MNTDDVSSWNFNVGIIMMASMYFFVCLTKYFLLSLHLSREGLLSCTQADRHNMVMKIQKGMRRKYMNTLSRALLPLSRVYPNTEV